MKKFILNQRIAVFSVLLAFCLMGNMEGQVTGPTVVCTAAFDICFGTCGTYLVNKTFNTNMVSPCDSLKDTDPNNDPDAITACLCEFDCEYCFSKGIYTDDGCISPPDFYRWEVFSIPYSPGNPPIFRQDIPDLGMIYVPSATMVSNTVYRVALTVCNSLGNPTTNTVYNIIQTPSFLYTAPQLSMQILTSPICANQNVVFQNTTPGYNADYWEINSVPTGLGGVWGPGNTFSYFCPSPGNYTCTMQVDLGFINSVCPNSNRIIVPFTVLAPSLTISTSSSICLGQVTPFYSQSPCVSNLYWNFGDGSYSTGFNPVHTYTLPGTYQVTASGTSTSGATITQTISVTVGAPISPVILAINPTTSMCNISGAQTYYLPVVPGLTYQWTVSGGSPVGFATNSLFRVNWEPNGGTVSVTVSDPVTGCFGTASYFVAPCCTKPAMTYQLWDGESSNLVFGSTLNIIGAKITVNGTFRINTSMTWSLCEVFLAKNAKIIVEPGITFTINERSVWKACDGKNMWDGIFIKNNSAKLKVSESRIQDAKNAVVSENGGVFEISKGNFDLNFKHVIVKAFNSPNPSKVSVSTFDCSNVNSLLAPYAGKRTQVAFEIFDNKAIQIGEAVAGMTNTIRNVQCGIANFRSGLKVYNNNFISMKTGLWAYPFREKCIYSESAVSPSNTNYLTVGGLSPYQENTFTDSRTGIYVINHQNYSIIKNKFTNISLNGIVAYQVVASLGLIRSNTLTKVLNGIVVNGSVITNTQISDNVYQYTGTNRIAFGTQFLRGTALSIQNIDIEFNTSSYQYLVQNNIFEVYGTGIHANHAIEAKIDNNTVRVENPISGAATGGNGFSGIRVSGCSEIEITENQIMTMNNSLNINTFGIHIATCPTSFTCHNDVSKFGNSLTYRANCDRSQARNNTFSTGINGVTFEGGAQTGNWGAVSEPSGNRWLGTFTYHRKSVSSPLAYQTIIYYDQNASALYNPTLSIFAPAVGGSAIGAQGTPGTTLGCNSILPLAAIQGSFISAIQIPNTPENKFLSDQYLVGGWNRFPTNITSDPTLIAYYGSISPSTITQNLDVLEKIANLDWAQAFTSNGSWTPSCLMEKNHKIVNDLIIRYHEVASIDWNPSDRVILESIANQCPNMGGNAVYEARTILDGLNETLALYETDCDYLYPQTAHKTSEASEASANDIEIQVYPNPARDQITISFKGTESTPDWIIIHDLNGKMMWKSNWVEEASEQTINTFTFEAGIYFVAIGTGNQTLHHQKLIIVR